MAKSTLLHLRQDGHLDARRSVIDADFGRPKRETLGLELGVVVEKEEVFLPVGEETEEENRGVLEPGIDLVGVDGEIEVRVELEVPIAHAALGVLEEVKELVDVDEDLVFGGGSEP